jgi:hypothetical protein
MVGCASTPHRSASAEAYYFDCDTASGEFSQWTRTIAATTIRATGTIELSKARKDPSWYPAASVWFIGPNESGNAGIQAFVAPDSPDHLQIRFAKSSPAISGPVFASLKWKDGPIPFSLSLSGPGVLSATIAGKTQSMSVATFPVAKFSLTCSTGEFFFKDILVATAADL